MNYITLKNYNYGGVNYLYLTKIDLINFLFANLSIRGKTKILQKLKNKNFYDKTNLFSLKKLKFYMCLDTHDKGKLFGNGYELCNHEDGKHFEIPYEKEVFVFNDSKLNKINRSYFNELMDFIK